MPALLPYYTADEVRAFPDDGLRYELVWGELLVSPAPKTRHQRIVLALARRLADYCERCRPGETMISPADISWSDDTLVQPDIFVVAPQESYAAEWSRIKTLRLVVEVLSPSTAKHDRFQKRRLYQASGVETLWLVDPDHSLLEVWVPNATRPVVETGRVTWHPSGADQPFVIEVAALLAPAP